MTLPHPEAPGAPGAATPDDVAFVYDLLLCSPPPEGAFAGEGAPPLDLVDLAGRLLGSAEFEPHILAPLRAGGFCDSALPPLDAQLAGWAVRRLPTAGGSGPLPHSRTALLRRLFTDPVFAREVVSRAAPSWSIVEFLPPCDAPAAERAFVEALLARRSTAIDRGWLELFGLQSAAEDAEALLRLGRLPWFRANGVFDPHWYGGQAGRRFDGYFAALQHYLEQGEQFGRAPSPFFPLERYASMQPELSAGVRRGDIPSLLEHFLWKDGEEGRSAWLGFSAADYLAETGPLDLGRHAGSPFIHYLDVGWRRGLPANPCFDEVWYLATYPDALAAVEAGDYPNGFSFYVQVGQGRGDQPHVLFDPEQYLATNPDVALAAAAIDPFQHFWRIGRAEGRGVDLEGFATSISRLCPGRLPDSCDVLDGQGRLARLHLTPDEAALRARVRASARGAPLDLTSLFEPGRRRALAEGDYVREVSVFLRTFAEPQVRLDAGARQQMHAGDAPRLFVSGFAYMPSFSPVAAEAWLGETQLPCDLLVFPRLDFSEHLAALGGVARDLDHGLLAWFDAPATLPVGVHGVELRLILADPQGVTRTMSVGVELQVDAKPRRSDARAPIQVLMAAYNAPPTALRLQVDSILADPRPHLLISDDGSPKGLAAFAPYAGSPRIDIDASAVNVGFVANFERALYMASPQAEALLLSDQDDVWRACKVPVLTAALAEGVSCAFSDQRIVTADGEVISETFWDCRGVHHHDSLTVGVANTVTGAAAAIPASLVDKLTPFPRYPGVFHDQWLSVIAAAAGRIAYVDQPLYDYVQHGANVLGFAGSRGDAVGQWDFIVRRLRRAVRRGACTAEDVEYARLALGQWMALLQRFIMWSEAVRRVDDWAQPAVRALTEQVLAAIRGEEIDLLGARRSWRRLRRAVGGDYGLLGIDFVLESVLLATRLVRSGALTPRDFARASRRTGDAHRLEQKRWAATDLSEIEKKTAPLEPALEPAPERGGGLRVTLFLPELRLATFFGGYYSKIALLAQLRRRGVPVRIVTVDQAATDAGEVARIAGAFPELEPGLRGAEIVAAGARAAPLPITDADVLVATTWWSAEIVHRLSRGLDRERFLYLIQEFEPFTFPMGGWWRAAELTYQHPHLPIFSTEILRDHFEAAGVGVFSEAGETWPAEGGRQLVFRNPIISPRHRQPLSPAARTRRLLFYARPQGHAARNMYELGLAALRRAAQLLGPELDGWELVGVGADAAALVPLTAGRSLRLTAKLDAGGYRQLLASSSVGLALMYTPHPSLVPLEMADAGLVTVTNACLTKTTAAMQALSPLLLAPEAETEAVAAAIVQAVRRASAGPVTAPPLNWPRSPAEAFDARWLDSFMAAAEASLATTATKAAPALPARLRA